MHVPTKVREVGRVVGLVNYYRGMWHKHEYTIFPLTKLCPMKVMSKWEDVENNHFIAMKKIVGRDVLLSYPNFSETFIIQTDANKK